MVNLFKCLPANTVVRVTYQKDDGSIDLYTVRLNYPEGGKRKWGQHLEGTCVVINGENTYINCSLITKNNEAAEGIRDFKISNILDVTAAATENQNLAIPSTTRDHVVIVQDGDGQPDSVVGPFTESDAMAWVEQAFAESPNANMLITPLVSAEDFSLTVSE